MELNENQKKGLEIAVARFNAGMPYTVIAGYAGTGKSTLIRFIISALGIDNQDVAYCAYTGKAAEVLRHKGCPNACTAHKLLYYSTKTVDGHFVFRPRTTLENPYKLIIVDEVSMLPSTLWEQLLKHKVPIIACGDPFQLPGITKEGDEAPTKVLDNPDIFLTEIMRQASDNEIIGTSMKIRNMERLQYKRGNQVQIIRPGEVIDGMLTWADQILVATNKKRTAINNLVRQMNGRSGPPQVGDKIISLENHWNILDTKGESALINGTIGYIKECKTETISYKIGPRFTIGPIQVYNMTIETDLGEIFENILVDKKFIDTGEKTLTPKQEYMIYKNKKILTHEAPCQVDYGYAITCHRAQGSQWGKTLIFEESFPFDKIEHARWLYTACTRPEEKLVLVR